LIRVRIIRNAAWKAKQPSRRKTDAPPQLRVIAGLAALRDSPHSANVADVCKRVAILHRARPLPQSRSVWLSRTRPARRRRGISSELGLPCS